MAALDTVSEILAEHASGGLFFAKEFTMLLYPASCVGWEFLDGGFPSVPPDTKLRFAMFAPWPQVRPNIDQTSLKAVTPIKGLGVQELPINTVLRNQFGLDFHRLVAQSNDKDGGKTQNTNTFFMIFPPAAQEEFELIVKWIQANRSATIYQHEDRGTWEHFHKSVDLAVIIVSV